MSIDWEQVEFQSKIKLIGGATPFKDNPEYWNGNIVWLSSQEIKNKYVSNGTYTITKKAIIDNKTRMVDAGTPLIVTRSGILAKRFPLSIPTIDVAINQDIKALLFDQSKLNVNFFVAELQSKEAYILKKIIKTGTTVQSVNLPDLNKLIISVVSDFKEQEKIGDFFQKLDHTIALQQRKLELLKKLKQGYLQQMLASKKQVIPLLRFNEFDENWKLKKLGGIAKSFSGGTPSAGDKKYYNGKTPFIRSAEINKKETELFLTESGLANSSAKLVSAGTILYALYGATSGEVGVSQIDGAINQAILAIIPNDEYSTMFIVQWLRNNKKKITDKYLQGGQGNLSGTIIKDLQIKFPSKMEQKLIGEFFKKLDQNITLQQSKINQLQQLKQAYLQKLFP